MNWQAIEAIGTWVVAAIAILLALRTDSKLQRQKLSEKWCRISLSLEEMKLHLSLAANVEGMLEKLWTSGNQNDPNEGRWIKMVESSLHMARESRTQIINALIGEKKISFDEKSKIISAISLDYVPSSQSADHATHSKIIEELNLRFVLPKADTELYKIVSSLRDSGS